jgi:hypothetical protein
MEFSEEPLQRLNQNDYSLLEDPFELQDSLMSFEYSVAYEPNVGLFKVTLINPSTTVEDLIFKWAARVTPRSWSSKSADRRKALEKDFTKQQRIFFRWGYSNNSVQNTYDNFAEPLQESKLALSHIHSSFILDIEFNTTNTRDRTVTLVLQDDFQIDVFRNKFKEIEDKTKVYNIPFVDSLGLLNTPSQIINDIIKTVISGSPGMDPVVVLNEPQSQKLDEELSTQFGNTDPGSGKSSLVRQQPSSDTVPKDKKSTDNKDSNFVYYEVLKQYFEYLDCPVTFKSLPGPPRPVSTTPRPVSTRGFNLYPETPEQVISLDQIGSFVPDPRDVAYETCERFNKEVADKLYTFYGEGHGQVVDFNNANTLFSHIPTPRSVKKFILYNPRKQSLTFTLNELQEISYEAEFGNADTDKVRIVPIEIDHPEGNLLSETTIRRFIEEEHESSFLAASTEGIPRRYDYSLSSLWLVKPQIDIYTETLQAKHDELIQQKRDEVYGGLPEISEDRQVLEDNPLGKTASDIKNRDIDRFKNSFSEPESVQSVGYVSVKTNNNHKWIESFVKALNSILFSTLDDPLVVSLIEKVNVPYDERNAIDALLPEPIDWDNNNTFMYLVMPNSLLEKVLEFASKIRSFSIQSESNPNVISLASGFNKRKDNIIVSLNHRTGKSTFFNSILETPVIPQRLFNIAKRFEQDDYRDIIVDTLEFVQNSPIDPSLSLDNLVEAIPAAAHLLVFGPVDGPGGYTNPQKTENLLKSIKEDLKYLYETDFLDVFFPVISNAPPTDEKFPDPLQTVRYVADCPLSVLQSGESDVAKALLYKHKIRSLSNFKAQMFDVKVRTLGIPEMDILAKEFFVRKAAIWVAEPRVPGTFHWTTGLYYISAVSHKYNVSEGYVTDMTLASGAAENTEEEMLKYSYTFLQDD